MSHTGIRLKITAGSAVLLEGDSDWLHMNAIMSGALHMPDTMAELMTDQDPPKYDWVEVAQLIGGPIQIWIQPCDLADEYPDDEAMIAGMAARIEVLEAAAADCCDDYISETDANCELPAGHDGSHYSAIEWGP